MSRLVVAPFLALLVLGLPACGDDDDAEKSSTTAGSRTTSTATTESGSSGSKTRATDRAAPPPRCVKVARPRPKGNRRQPRPKIKLDPARVNEVVMTTSCGVFTIRLDVKRAPKTSESFAWLTRRQFFDGLTFHRIVANFVIQGGDPLGNGTGGPGYKVIEAPPNDLAYTKYVVAMAKSEIEDPGTSGSQFYVVTVDDSGLDPQYALVGKVTKGQNAVDLIGAVQTDPTNERPVKPVVIRSARLVITGAAAGDKKAGDKDDERPASKTDRGE